MSSDPIVQVQGLTKKYFTRGDTVHVLRGIDCSVYPGEFLAIMGASGSGKSTLLHILGCLEKPSEGHYLLEGKNVSELGDKQLAGLRHDYIGFIFQDFHLMPYATVFENVALPFLYATGDSDGNRQQILQAVAEVGLSHRLNHRPSALSGGERQRVAIARAIVCKPRLILADEPTGNLDSSTGSEIIALLRKLHDNGATLLLVTHDYDVASVASRKMIMRDGKFCEQS